MGISTTTVFIVVEHYAKKGYFKGKKREGEEATPYGNIYHIRLSDEQAYNVGHISLLRKGKALLEHRLYGRATINGQKVSKDEINVRGYIPPEYIKGVFCNHQ